MLQLKNIHKSYKLGNTSFPALKNINLSFRSEEFVTILGPSGCGKTTLLNLIGGLDHMDSGDLMIDGVSTVHYKDSNWDRYRNNVVGFVFQSYNLITHLSILDNVAMTLTLSGVSKKERLHRARCVLEEVGLTEHMHKRPNQLSGGQMQRVAIARALVNNPAILLADEPTGALDTQTSASIMELIQKLSQHRLVIMVTHNNELAHAVSSRIIQLKDGEVVADSHPYSTHLNKQSHTFSEVSMSYAAALSSSFKNLLTKKGRTLITSFAGSIGIIGIALVLALSAGMENYVARIESETLAGFPLQLNHKVTLNDITRRPLDIFQPITPSDATQGVVVDTTVQNVTHVNIFNDNALAMIDSLNPDWINSISLQRNLALNVATLINDTPLIVETSINTSLNPLSTNTSLFFDLPDDANFVLSLYDLVAGVFPTQANEALFIIAADSTIDKQVVNALQLNLSNPFQFSELLNHQFTFIAHDVLYAVNGNQVSIQPLDKATYSDYRNETITIVGVIRLKPDVTSSFLSVGVGMLSEFSNNYFTQAQISEVAQLQLSTLDYNVVSGLPFNTFNTHELALKTLGADLTPQAIFIYPRDFASKQLIMDAFALYNEGVDSRYQLLVTDIAQTFSSTISTLISTITLILSAFAAISLVVSSIMIGIITYISVIERTKEIGIMRSLGARKKDIARIFNAEALIIGLCAGLIGISISLFALIVVDMMIESVLGVASFSMLSLFDIILLVGLSAALTLIAGVIPSQLAAQQDPVVALRSE